MRKRHAGNALGNWYIDTACSDCTAARTVAPGLIVEKDGQSVFARQPQTEDEIRMAWRARLLCPTASVRSDTATEQPADVFPERMTEGVYRLGYNAAHAAGAHSFLVRRDTGSIMVDSPRWTRAVTAKLEEWGGLAHIVLTHRDDVGDAEAYAKHFGALVWIHEWDRAAAKFVSDLIRGREPTAIVENFIAVPVPGHTKGSVVFLHDGHCLFTGDSLAWDFEEGDLSAWREFCWYSWDKQATSLARLAAYDFDWVFAGHGGSHHLPAREMRARLEALVARMKNGEG
jgi:glyoxylase-like metal-dependent hydrolase (beta-lactamase superfamily II)